MINDKTFEIENNLIIYPDLEGQLANDNLKVQSLSDFLLRPPDLTVRDEVGEVVEKFQYLGWALNYS